MKKQSSPRTDPAPLTNAVRSDSARRSRRSSSNSGQTSTRLEIAPPSQLALTGNLSPALTPDLRPVRFGYFKPDAREVHVAGSFNGWDTRATPLQRDAQGDWSVSLDLPPGEHRYRFFVDGRWCDDPSAARTVPNPFGGVDAVRVVV